MYRLVHTQAFRCIEEYLFSSGTLYTDFEKAIHTAVNEMLLERCRFHISEAWGRKIQSAKLTEVYKNKKLENSKLLKYFFGMPLLPSEEVDECFLMLMVLKLVDPVFDDFFYDFSQH